jgi:hypothetical protein
MCEGVESVESVFGQFKLVLSDYLQTLAEE